MKASNNLTSLSDFIGQEHGPVGSKPREEFEAGYEVFKLGAMLQQARQAKGLTQAQLAELAGTDKSYISKLEKERTYVFPPCSASSPRAWAGI